MNFTGLCAGAVPLSSSLFSLSFCLIFLGCGSLTIFPQGTDYPHPHHALLFPPCPSAISGSVGSEGKGQGWSQDLILRGEMSGQGRKWEDSLPLLLPGGTICYEIMLCQLERPRCISAASAGGGRRAHSSSHKQRAVALPFLRCPLVTFLSLMLLVFH